MNPTSIFALVVATLTITAVAVVSVNPNSDSSDLDAPEPAPRPAPVCWFSFENNDGMSTVCTITPDNGTRFYVEYAMISNGSSMTIADGEPLTGYGRTDWAPIDGEVVILATGSDSFPDDPRSDFFVVYAVE